MNAHRYSGLTKGEATTVLREDIGALAPLPRKLLLAMAASATGPESLDLILELAAIPPEFVRSALKQLQDSAFVDRDGYLDPAIREAAKTVFWSRRHAEVVRRRVEVMDVQPWRAARDLADLRRALSWALANTEPHSTETLAKALAYNGFLLAWRVGSLDDAFAICRCMSEFARSQNDGYHLQTWLSNEALILRAWGRHDEALAVHREEEALCRELGKTDGLQTSFGNQALVLRDLGQVEEALLLLQQQQEICLQLGNQVDWRASCQTQAELRQPKAAF